MSHKFFLVESHDVGIQNIRSASEKYVQVKKLGSSDE